MSEKGVFAVDRGIFDDGDFENEPFTQREAWLWLIKEAAWKDCRKRGAHGPVNLKRGELCHSVRFMAAAWQWSKSRVDRFLHALKRRDMIRDTQRDSERVYIIKNYNKFQIVGLPERDSQRDTSGTQAGQQRDRLETLKHYNSVSKDTDGARPSNGFVDDRTFLFRDGLSALREASGKSEAACRGLLGMWLKANKDDPTVVLAALGRMDEVRPAEPISWLNAVLMPKPKTPRQLEIEQFKKAGILPPYHFKSPPDPPSNPMQH